MVRIGEKIHYVYCVMLQKSCVVYIYAVFNQNVPNSDTECCVHVLWTF